MFNVHDRRQINTLKFYSPHFKHVTAALHVGVFLCVLQDTDVELMFSKILLVVLFTVFTLVMLNMLCIQPLLSILSIVVPDSLYYTCSPQPPQRTWSYLHKSTCACWPEKLKVEKQLQMQSKLTWTSLFLFTITANLIHEKGILQNIIMKYVHWMVM